MPLPSNERRLLIIDHPIEDRVTIDLLGDILPHSPPGGRLICPVHEEGDARFLLTFDSSAEGIVSRFHTLGQWVRLGATVEEVARSPLLTAEIRTLVERLCYQHRLGHIEVAAAHLLPVAEPAARLLNLECAVNPGLFAMSAHEVQQQTH